MAVFVMEQFICSIEVIFYSETEFPLYLQGKPATEGAHDSKDDPKAETELATPWRGTVCAVLKQGFPVCQPAGSRFSSDFPVVRQGFPICPPAGSRHSSDFPVSEWQDFVLQWCFRSRNLLCTGPKPSRNRQFFVLERYGDSVVSVL